MNNRRKLIASISAFGLYPLVKLGFLAKRKEVISCAPEIKTIKMLTQDGKLVEVEMSKISGAKEKISNQQLKEWVKKEL